MGKEEEIHYKAVIAADNQEPPKDYAISAHADHFNGFVEGFVEGYHQAEKDLELSWEDIREIYCITLNLREHLGASVFGEPLYQEVLKRFKAKKNVEQEV